MSAVHGGTYVLGRQITSMSQITEKASDDKSRYQIVIDGLPTPIRTACIIGTPKSLSTLSPPATKNSSPTTELLRGVMILDRPLHPFGSPSPDVPSKPQDTLMVVIPPQAIEESRLEGSVTFLITGEGSQSAPRGKGKCNGAGNDPRLDIHVRLSQSSYRVYISTGAEKSRRGSKPKP